MDMNDEETLYGMLLHDDDERSILQQWYDEMGDRTLTPEQRERSLLTLSTEHKGEYDEKALADAVAWIGKTWERMSAGELPVDLLPMVIRSQAYESAVAVARHEGEVEGRNSRIEQIIDDRMLSGAVWREGNDERSCGWLTELGALNNASRLTIWERGGERRQ